MLFGESTRDEWRHRHGGRNDAEIQFAAQALAQLLQFLLKRFLIGENTLRPAQHPLAFFRQAAITLPFPIDELHSAAAMPLPAQRTV